MGIFCVAGYVGITEEGAVAQEKMPGQSPRQITIYHPYRADIADLNGAHIKDVF